MDFELSEMQQMVVDSAQRFVAAETGLDHWRARRNLENGVDPALWIKVVELGWLALAIPEDAGGLSGSMEDVALLMIELGKGLVTEPLVSSGVLAAYVLDRTLIGEARETWLDKILLGEARIALAISDPDAASGAVAPLFFRPDGDGFVLDGCKCTVFDAPSADTLLVVASAGNERALFLVDAAQQGIEAKAYPLVDGTRAADIVFANVGLPAGALLARGDAAAEVIDAAIDRARLALVAQAVGAMEAAIAITAQYAKDRRQFGQPIGKFQAIQHMAADMFVAAYQARSALYAALRDVEGNADARARAVAVAKVVSGLAGQTVSRNGIQIHGGYGLTDEYAISHYYRRLLVLEKQYGSIDMHGAALAQIEARD
jgi:alkylation response protein AidB-like acyl-CoA dehydrogenase